MNGGGGCVNEAVGGLAGSGEWGVGSDCNRRSPFFQTQVEPENRVEVEVLHVQREADLFRL